MDSSNREFRTPLLTQSSVFDLVLLRTTIELNSRIEFDFRTFDRQIEITIPKSEQWKEQSPLSKLKRPHYNLLNMAEHPGRCT